MAKRQLAHTIEPVDHDRSRKRLRTDVPDFEHHDDWRPPKRELIADPAVKSSPVSRVDPTYGQRGALPGLDDGCEDGSDKDELSKDAIAYLRAVRSEAGAIPNLLTASVPSDNEEEHDRFIYDSGYGDSRGYYSDGAYIAAPTFGPEKPAHRLFLPHEVNGEKSGELNEAEFTQFSPQQAYYNRLSRSFLAQRKILHRLPPSEAIAALTPKQIISLPAQSRRAFRHWRFSLQSMDPSPVQLASMDNETALRLLRLMTSMLRRNRNLDARFGAWIWGVLGRLGEVGTLGSEEVSVVRDLGKRAVWVGCGFAENEIASATEHYGENSEDAIDNEDEEGQHSETGSSSGEPDANIHESEDAPRRDSPTTASNADLAQPELMRSAGTPGSHAVLPVPQDADLEAAKVRLLSLMDSKSPKSQPIDSPHQSDIQESSPTRLLSSSPNEDGEITNVEAETNPNENNMRDEDLGEEVPDKNTLATLDMIITVAGEFYGQRDLLEFRECWV